MGRRANQDLKTRTSRSAFPIQLAPYCENIVPGRVLGYIRKGPKVAGTWIIRIETEVDGKRVRTREKIGVADDLVDANGIDVLSYAQAKALAAKSTLGTAAHNETGCTLNDAVEQHRNYAGKKGKKQERNRKAAYRSLRYNLLGLTADSEKVRPGVTIIRAIVNGKLPEGAWALDRNMLVNEVTTELLTALRGQWIIADDQASYATALRKWTDIHSCLEQAFGKPSNKIPSQAAWKHVAKMDQDGVARVCHFTDEQAVAILNHIYARDSYVAQYLEGLYRCGARPGGEMFALRVCHFEPAARRITIQGQSATVKAKNGGRRVSLAPTALPFFTRLCEGRDPNAPMFTSDGVNALSHNISERIKAVLVEAVRHVLGAAAFEGVEALTDEDIVPYVFRHTFISRRIAKGIPAKVIGDICGTSDWMIKKTYAKLFPEEHERWLVDTDTKTTLTVVPVAVPNAA